MCPRLAVHKSWFPKEDVRIGAAGGHVVNGNLFHSRIVERILIDLADVEVGNLIDEHDGKRELKRIVEANGLSQEEIRIELWRVFCQSYMAPVLRELSDQLGNNPNEQVAAMSQGLGELAGLCAALLMNCAILPAKTRRFLPPEGVVQQPMQVDGKDFELVGNYDGLWFDPVSEEFILIDFKCKTSAEFPSDLHQLTCYSWLIQGKTGRPVRGVLVYVQPEPEVRHLSAIDLAEAYPKSEEFVRFVARLLRIKRRPGVVIKETAMPDLCQRCPLDDRCDALYGSRSQKSA